VEPSNISIFSATL